MARPPVRAHRVQRTRRLPYRLNHPIPIRTRTRFPCSGTATAHSDSTTVVTSPNPPGDTATTKAQSQLTARRHDPTSSQFLPDRPPATSHTNRPPLSDTLKIVADSVPPNGGLHAKHGGGLGCWGRVEVTVLTGTPDAAWQPGSERRQKRSRFIAQPLDSPPLAHDDLQLIPDAKLHMCEPMTNIFAPCSPTATLSAGCSVTNPAIQKRCSSGVWRRP